MLQRFVGNCRLAFCDVQQMPCVQHAFIFSSTDRTLSSELFPSFLLSTVNVYFLVYLVLRAGLPACVTKERVLNLPLWAKINSEALNLASGGCQRWYQPSLEALILDTQFVANFSLGLLCCGAWKITAFQRRVLHGDLWQAHGTLQPHHLGTVKFLLLVWKPGDFYKFWHRYTLFLAVLCSVVYTFRKVSEVSWFMLETNHW